MASNGLAATFSIGGPAMATTTPDQVLTLYEAAELLQVSVKTLWSEARNEKVPCFKIGKQYRFIRADILAWARGQAETQN